MMRTRTTLAGGAIVLAAGALAVAGFSAVQPKPPDAASIVAGATASITRGSLRDTKTVTGTLSYGELSVLRPALAGSALVTWIAPEGAVVERGQPLYALDGQDVILLYGDTPQHRTLRFDSGAASPNWVELEKAETAVHTARLSLDLERARQADATARVEDATVRLDDAVSSKPTTAQFIRLAGAVDTAEASLARVKELAAAKLSPVVQVAAADADLAVARAALDEAVRALHRELAGAQLDVATIRVAVAEAQIRLDEFADTLSSLSARASDDSDVRQLTQNLSALGYEGALAEQVRAWQRDAGFADTGIVGPRQVFVAPGPVHIGTHNATVGETLAASSQDRGPILSWSGIDRLVTFPLNVSDQALAALGRTVVITLPDGTEVEGAISEIGSVVTDGAIEVTVAIADQHAIADLEVASVEVELVSDIRDDVLSVPVTALLARPEGGFAVELVTGASRTLVPVETGLFAAGRVEVTGEGIAEDMHVGVPG